MTAEDPQTAALVAHIVSQIEQNVQFLASQNYITAADASAIVARLPAPGAEQARAAPSAMSQLSSKFSRLVSPHPAAPPVPTAPPAASAPPPVQARALWGYNEDGKDPNDLTFSAGDVIEIVEETNADWWTGRFKGRQGLVPANYMEKLAAPVSMPMPAPAPAQKAAYKPFGAAYHGVNAPPPAGQGVNSVGLQEKPNTEEKKGKLGQYKNTLAHSAAGGVGFGAGAAIGGGLVRAIF